MNKAKNIFIAYRNGTKYIGTADEVALEIKSRAASIRKVAEGGFINGYFVKQITHEVIIYCIDKDGKHYESKDTRELQKIVWYAPKSIKRYCVDRFVLKDGTRFYCKKEMIDTELPKERFF